MRRYFHYSQATKPWPIAEDQTAKERDEEMELRAELTILGTDEWLNADGYAEKLGLQLHHSSQALQKWLHHGKIFQLLFEGDLYYPTYAFDDRTWTPHLAMQRVIQEFGYHRRPWPGGWTLAYWFHSANAMLGNSCPKDIYKIHLGSVLYALHDVLVRELLLEFDDLTVVKRFPLGH